MSDVLYLDNRIYVLSTSSLVDDRRGVLKHGESFGVFDRRGDVAPIGMKEQGLYHEGCRHLSRLELLVAGLRPIVLGSAVPETTVLEVDLTNPDIVNDGGTLRHGGIHVLRSKVLWGGTLIERITVSSYEDHHIDLPIHVRAEADFVDIFEVRGANRSERGVLDAPIIEQTRVIYTYHGLDNLRRRTTITSSPEPLAIQDGNFEFSASLPPRGQYVIEFSIKMESGEESSNASIGTFENLVEESSLEIRRNKILEASILSSNSRLASWVHQSLADIHMLTTMMEDGPFPYAGVPWFSAVFGRDAIITALMALWINPIWAKGVLSFLARNQANDEDPTRESQPGKILHEVRLSEMARTGEVPFAFYYGSVDSTPLFVVLAWEYFKRTADTTFMQQLWPNVLKALEWMDRYGDVDGDGFVEYAPWGVRGLTQQGWKDSPDPVFHRDGVLADAPIALCEVQGYVYAAKVGAAEIAERLGDPERAMKLRSEAEVLRKAFHDRFWDSELECYALALDGHKRPCSVRTSNAAHALFSGIAEPSAAAVLARTLFRPDMFSGWGIRTVSTREARYNPLSYHNGSIWPHDNGIAALGLARYGYQSRSAQLLSAFLDASSAFAMQRLPELFSGFERRAGQGPTPYPVACSPQAWAAATVFALLQSCLGLSIDAFQRRLVIEKPSLPEGVDKLELRNVTLGDTTVDIALERYEQDVGVHVLRRGGDVGVWVLK